MVPNRRIVHMMRDPRAIFVSEVRRRRATGGGFPYSLLRDIPPLLSAVRTRPGHRDLAEGARRFARYWCAVPTVIRTLRSEDLLQAPEEQLRGPCGLAGVDFEPAMLEQAGRERGARLGQVWH